MNYKKLIYMKIIGVVALILGLSSCSQDPIFAAIEQEIALKDPNVRGLVTSLVRVENGETYDLYTTTGNIYKKTNGSGDWKSIKNPSSVHRCSMLASSGTELYALFENEKGKSKGIYSYNGSSWISVSDITGATFLAGQGTVFAFTGSGSEYTAYTISGGATTGITGTFATPIGASGTYFATTGGVYDVAGTTATLLDGTGAPTSKIRSITTSGTPANLYVEADGKVYHYGESGWSATSITHDQTSPTSIAYFSDNSGAIILVGGTGGYREVVLDANGVPSSAQKPGSSAISSISTSSKSQYENSLGLWTIHSIFTDGTTIYAGITEKSTSKRGLWGYYQNKGEWNRE